VNRIFSRKFALAASGFVVWLSFITTGCQQETLLDEIQQDGASAYVDEQGNTRVPTWLTYSGHVQVGAKVYESTRPVTVLLPKSLWMIEEIESLQKVGDCVTSYTYTQSSDFTVTEGNYMYFTTYKDACSGQRCWTHTVEVKSVNTFHNNPHVWTEHYEVGGSSCYYYAVHDEVNEYADASYSAGTKFSVTGNWINNFDSDNYCNGGDLKHAGVVVLPPTGGSASATFDYMIIKATSTLCED